MRVITRPSVGFHALIMALLIGPFPPAQSSAADKQAVYTLRADGIACPFCAYGIEKQLSRIVGIESVSTDVKNGTVIITMKADTTLDEADAKRAVDAAGFTMREFTRKDVEA